MVVRLSVGIVRFVVEVECDIEEVDDLEVSFNCDVQSVSLKMSRDVLSRPYHNSSKRCDLCLAEKLHIIKRSNNNLLNKNPSLYPNADMKTSFILRTIDAHPIQ